jgi:flavodoxin
VKEFGTMKTLVVYDSEFGNTEKIARAIAAALGPQETVAVKRVGEVQPPQLAGLDLLVVGSPTQRFRPTPAINQLLKELPSGALAGVRVAAFDTRLTEAELGQNRVLGFFVGIFGYAAKPIADQLEKQGGTPAAPPEGFYVAGMEGPLLEGELARAEKWAGQLLVAG